MDEIAADVREGLLAIAVGAGLQVMAAMMAADVESLCGPKSRHDPDRPATRHGSEAGSVALGGRRLPVRRPRVRAVDGAGATRELPVASYEGFNDTAGRVWGGVHGPRGVGPQGEGAVAARRVAPPLRRRPGADRRPGDGRGDLD